MPNEALPRLDIRTLNFDTCERLRHLDQLLDELAIDSRARILDVGGYPGYFARAFPGRRTVTADIFESGHPPYVKASGAALPFPADTFDAVVACDVLEHVPPRFRQPFVMELTRVSKNAIILAGPYDTPGVRQAEKLVRNFLPPSSPAISWLTEHADYGVPDLLETLQSFERAGAGCSVVPAGGLLAWILLFNGQAAGEASFEIGKRFQDFIGAHNDLGLESWKGSGPAYRHAVVAQKKLQLPASGRSRAAPVG